MKSFPRPPSAVSSPFPVISTSWPPPPRTLSSPFPERTRSLPPPASTVSSPLKVTTMSRRSVPVTDWSRLTQEREKKRKNTDNPPRYIQKIENDHSAPNNRRRSLFMGRAHSSDKENTVWCLSVNGVFPDLQQS